MEKKTKKKTNKRVASRKPKVLSNVRESTDLGFFCRDESDETADSAEIAFRFFPAGDGNLGQQPTRTRGGESLHVTGGGGISGISIDPGLFWITPTHTEEDACRVAPGWNQVGWKEESSTRETQRFGAVSLHEMDRNSGRKKYTVRGHRRGSRKNKTAYKGCAHAQKETNKRVY